MKRPHVEPGYSEPIWRFRTWFYWVKCEACGLDFRREHGWRSWPSKGDGYRHVCAACCPTKADAAKVFEAHPWRGTKPRCELDGTPIYENSCAWSVGTGKKT